METYTLYRIISIAGMLIGRLLNLYTIELPYNNGDNHPDLSCIPAGIYNVIWVMSPDFGFLVPQLQDVNGRTFIEMHKANWPSDLLGCIGLGKDINLVEAKLGIENSGIAFDEFASLTNRQPFKLEIINSF